MLTVARALAVLACLLPLTVPAAADAALDLDHVAVQAVPLGGDGDDVVNHGDAFQLTETLSTVTALNNATGKLFTPTPGVDLDTDTAPFASAPAGGTSRNTRPFEGALASDVTCGANLSFTVGIDATGGQDSVSFLVPTGAEAPPQPYDSLGGVALADASATVPGVTNAQLNVPGNTRVKRMEVRIGSLSHPRLSDLELALVAPDGQVVVLAGAGSLSGTTMTDTVFADGVLPGLMAPYSGRMPSRDSLASLEGHALNGTWMLRITDKVAGEAGTLGPWGLDGSRAACVGIPKAAFTMSANPALPGDVVEFDAGDSLDANGEILKYEWDLDGDGQYDDDPTPVDASDPLRIKVKRQYPAKTSVLVRLRITDNDGLTDVEQRRLPVTERPVAQLSASPTSPLTGDTVRLDAAGSADPDGTVVEYQWALDSNAPERTSGGASYLDVTFDRPKTYDVTVWAIDEDGAAGTAQVQVVVRNRPPVAAIADPGLALAGRVTTLSAAGSADPDGTIDWYEWDLNNDGTYDVGKSSAATLDHTFTTPGPKTVRVRVTDDKGETATSTRSFTVTSAPIVVATATPNPVSLRRDVVLDASASADPDDAGPLTFAWDLENDGTFEPAGPATRTVSWPTAGTRAVKVRVTDASGAVTVGGVNVVVRNMLPVASLTATPVAPKAGEATQLDAVAMDPDGTIARYQWDLDGDGGYELDTGMTPTATASFANAGSATVGVRVTDNDGGTGVKTLALVVAQPDPVDPGDGGGSTPPPDDGGGTTGGTTTTPAGTTAPGAGPAPDGEDPTQPAGGPADGPPPPVDPARPFGAWLGGAAIQRTRLVVQRGLLVSCRSEVAVWCSITASVAARDAKRLRLGRKAVVVGRTAVPVAEGTVERIRLKLTAKTRRALRGTGGVRVLVRAAARAADGREVALSRVVLLRR